MTGEFFSGSPWRRGPLASPTARRSTSLPGPRLTTPPRPPAAAVPPAALGGGFREGGKEGSGGGGGWWLVGDKQSKQAALEPRGRCSKASSFNKQSLGGGEKDQAAGNVLESRYRARCALGNLGFFGDVTKGDDTSA